MSQKSKQTLPVSYTHLDVYKRQIPYFPAYCKYQYLVNEHPCTDPGMDRALLSYAIAHGYNDYDNDPEKVEAVSYTHLMNAELVNSKEVDDIVSTIEVYNMDTIVSFGAKACLLYTSCVCEDLQ